MNLNKRLDNANPHNLSKGIIGVSLCILAYVIKWFGSYQFQPLDYHLLSLPIFLSGIILLLFNFITLKTTLFPILFLFLLIPPPTTSLYLIGSKLSILSSQISYFILQILGQPVSLSFSYGSPIIYLKSNTGVNIPFAIDIACSGIYSLIAFLIFVIFISYISRGPALKKIPILIIGLPLLYTMNIIRIISIILIGNYLGQGFALNIFHLLGGWNLLLIATLILFSITEKILNIQIFSTKKENCSHTENEIVCEKCGIINVPPASNITKREMLRGLLIIMITLSTLIIQVPVIALNEGYTEVFIQKPSGDEIKKILPEIDGYTLSFAYKDEEFEEITGQDASLMFQYQPNSPNYTSLWVGVEIAPALRSLHPWELCLVSGPISRGIDAKVVQLDLKDIHLFENPPLSARYFTFKEINSNRTQVILYWYTRSLFKSGENYIQKWSKISLIKFTNNPSEYVNIESELLPNAVLIAGYWRSLTNWSWLAIAIAKAGPSLMLIILTIIIGITTYTYLKKEKYKKRAKQTYNHLTDFKDKSIIDAIKFMEKKPAVLSDVAELYENHTKEKINNDSLVRKINQAVESGLINNSIININDEPYLSWSVNFNENRLLGKIKSPLKFARNKEV